MGYARVEHEKEIEGALIQSDSENIHYKRNALIFSLISTPSSILLTTIHLSFLILSLTPSLLLSYS